MALPSTQKEVTTRRIASLISGLWNKVKNAFLLKTSRGAANGVASLDANGKVPTSQLPTVPTGNLPSNSSSSAGIVASGSGQQNRVWGTDSNGNPSWSKVRANMLESNINISGNSLTAGRSLGTNTITVNNKKYKFLGKVVLTKWVRYSARFQIGPGDGQRNCDVMINVQRNANGSGTATELDAVFFANTDGSNLSDLGIYYSYDSSTYTYYFYLGVFNSLTFVRCLYSNGFSFDAPTTTPSSLTRIANNRRAMLGPSNSGVGSVNTPVFVNSNGVLEPCNLSNKRNFPKLNFFKNGSNGERGNYIKVATITCGSRYLDHPFIFRCITRYRFMFTIYFMPEVSTTTKPGIKHFLVEIPVEDSSSTVNVRLTYDDSGENRVYTLWFNPGVWSDISTVLESENDFAQHVTLISEQYSASLTNPIAPQYIKYAHSTTPGSRIGSESTPIFMEDTGTLKPCALPQTISFSSLSNTPQQRVIARLAYVASNSNSVMTLMVTQGEGFGQKDSCGIYFVQASYRGTPSLRTTVINSGSSSGSHCTFAYYTGSESGTNYMYIVAKRPQYSASMTVMQIGAFELDGSMASPSKKIYDGGNVSSSGLTDGTVILCAVAPSGGVGNGSTPIFMENTGTLKPCTGGSLINYEVTSAVPSSPTAGKFYFIS